MLMSGAQFAFIDMSYQSQSVRISFCRVTYIEVTDMNLWLSLL